MSKVELTHITKDYPGGVRAVDNLSLTLGDGEIVALLGPSGCGKSTVLRLIAGFETPNEGLIRINGASVAGNGTWVEPERRGVGMVFQDYPLFPNKTVAQNIAFGLHRLPKAEIPRRVAAVLGQVNLSECAGRFPHQLSGGQQQRVALAQALAPRPAVLLLDEPFSNLDASLRYDLRLEVREILKNAGTSAIMVTHDQKEAFAMADRVGVMNNGQIEQIGTPATLYGEPRTPFVARFLGHSALLEGVVYDDTTEVLTDLGMVPCAVGLAESGERVFISLRPDSFVVDPDGPFVGLVLMAIQEGHAVELAVQLPCGHGTITVRTYVPSEMGVLAGQSLRFSIVPEKVAIIPRPVSDESRAIMVGP